MSTGVLLYGPPASGKDTVTDALAGLSPQYALFSRLKCGEGRTHGYRLVDRDQLEALDSGGDIIWRNQRYGATYAVDRTGLNEHLQRGTPVVHIGQAAAIDAITAATPHTAWLVIGLWCERSIAALRLSQRGSPDIAQRLQVWDSTPSLIPPATTLNTGLIAPGDAANLIRVTIDRMTRVPAS